MRPTFAFLLVGAAAALCALVVLGHWSFDRSLTLVCGVLFLPGMTLLGLVWMFVPAAQRPQVVSEFRDKLRQNLHDFLRALTSR